MYRNNKLCNFTFVWIVLPEDDGAIEIEDGRVEESGTVDVDKADDDGGGNRGTNSNCVFLSFRGTSGN